MGLIQFLRILIARRWLVLGTAAVCVLTAIVVGFFLPKNYEGKARVVLDLVKPDPVTGQTLASSFARAYIQTQVELIRDQGTMGAVVDTLGWANNPALAKNMGGEGATPDDIREALINQLIGRTEVGLVAGSNVMEIVYRGQSPEQARALSGMIRGVYLDRSLNLRKEEARRNANWYQQQLDRAQSSLQLAEAAKSKFQRENGIVLEQDQQQLSSLTQGATSAQAMAAQAGAGAGAGLSSMAGEGLRMQLAELDTRLTTVGTQLGPNHPTLKAMQRQRATLAAQIGQVEAAAAAQINAGASAAQSGAAALRREMEAQKARLLASGEKYDQLAAMQRDIERRKVEYQSLAERLSALRLEANTTEAGMTLLGDPIADESPSGIPLPVLWVIAAGFGMVLGLLLGVLTEMLARRVRGLEDLEHMAPVPVLAVLSDRAPRGGWLRKLLKPRETDLPPAMGHPAAAGA